MLRTPLAAHHVFVAKLVSDGPTFFAARLIAGDGDSAAQVGGDEPGRGVLPVVQRALWDLGDQPLPGPPGGRIQTGGGRVLRICTHTDDVWEIQRVVVAPRSVVPKSPPSRGLSRDMPSARTALSSLARSSGWSGAPRAASRSSITGREVSGLATSLVRSA
jgi:hypothetical protein